MRELNKNKIEEKEILENLLLSLNVFTYLWGHEKNINVNQKLSIMKFEIIIKFRIIRILLHKFKSNCMKKEK